MLTRPDTGRTGIDEIPSLADAVERAKHLTRRSETMIEEQRQRVLALRRAGQPSADAETQLRQSQEALHRYRRILATLQFRLRKLPRSREDRPAPSE